ncbi:MAG: FAD-binding oxidoreductase, partial [Nannocystaceae bacterium]
MRRWNGWGDDGVDASLRPDMQQFLHANLGPGNRRTDVTLAQAIADVPASRAPKHPLLKDDPRERLMVGRGQSFPDWVEWRWGLIGGCPDAVAKPTSHDEVQALVDFANKTGVRLIPYGGGTSVVGHLTPLPGEAPVVTVDMRSLKHLLAFDPKDRLATFGAGVVGPAIEAQLKPHGMMLGHFPQSYEYSTLGGWVVTRSSGQQSLRYGRIENMFAGGRVVTPTGELVVPAIPASGAGTDIRELVLGSEGRIGLLTEATVRITAAPEVEQFDAGFLPTWSDGLNCVRELAQAGVPLSMMRLSNAIETRTNLLMAGKGRAIRALQGYLKVRGVGEGRCMLILGYTGTSQGVRRQRRAARSAVRGHRGVLIGRPIGDAWARNR